MNQIVYHVVRIEEQESHEMSFACHCRPDRIDNAGEIGIIHNPVKEEDGPIQNGPES